SRLWMRSIRLTPRRCIWRERSAILTGQLSEVPTRAGGHAAGDRRFDLRVLPNGTPDLLPENVRPPDAIFVDGDHSAGVVEHDSRLAREIVTPGGIIVWHDYLNPTVQVTEVLERLASEGWPIVHVADSWLAYMRA